MRLRSMLRLLLPYRRTTEAKAQEAIVRCGISPDDIEWRVDADGSFAFGRKDPDSKNLTYEQVECLTDWACRERIRLGIIAWEGSDD